MLRQKTIRLTTAQAILRYFAAQHTRRDGRELPLIGGVFGIFGHGNASGFGHALATGAGGLTYHQGKSEQAMVHAAIGYARAHNLASTLAVTASIGPASTNLVTGAGTATLNRVPVLLLPGDVFASRRQGPILQGLEMAGSYDMTVNDTLRPVSRFFDRITRPEQIIHSLPHATAALLDHGQAGAVTVAVCQDVEGEAFDFPLALFETRVHDLERLAPSESVLAAAAERVRTARKPIIIAGGGVRYAEAEASLAALSNACGIPVVESFAGRGAGRAASLNAGGIGFIGSPAANELATEADLVLAVGTRLSDTLTGSHTLFQNPDVSFVALNLAERDLCKMGALALRADARAGLDGLAAALEGHTAPAEWRDRADRAIVRHVARVGEIVGTEKPRMTGYEAVAEIKDAARREDRVVFSSSTAIGQAHTIWDSRSDAPVDMEYGFSCMGYEIPAALGAAMAGTVKGRILALIGDGTFLMGNTTEIVTAIQEGLAFTIVVVVNRGWQCIRGHQLGSYGEEFGTQFRRREGNARNLTGETLAIDYVANARSLGADGVDVHSRAELRAALERARRSDRPFLIAAHVEDAPLPIESGAWWEFGIPQADAPEGLRETRAAFETAAAKHRWFV